MITEGSAVIIFHLKPQYYAAGVDLLLNLQTQGARTEAETILFLSLVRKLPPHVQRALEEYLDASNVAISSGDQGAARLALDMFCQKVGLLS